MLEGVEGLRLNLGLRAWEPIAYAWYEGCTFKPKFYTGPLEQSSNTRPSQGTTTVLPTVREASVTCANTCCMPLSLVLGTRAVNSIPRPYTPQLAMACTAPLTLGKYRMKCIVGAITLTKTS